MSASATTVIWCFEKEGRQAGTVKCAQRILRLIEINIGTSTHTALSFVCSAGLLACEAAGALLVSVFVKMRNPMILVAIVAVILAAIVVGFALDDKTTPTTQLPRLGDANEFTIGPVLSSTS